MSLWKRIRDGLDMPRYDPDYQAVFMPLVVVNGIVIATLLPLLLFAEALVVTRLGSLYPGAFLAWAGWTLLYAIIWTVVTVGFSAAVSSRYRSLAVIFATFLFFGDLWDQLLLPAVAVVVTGRFSVDAFAQSATPPMWFQYTDHLSPFVALDTLRDGFFEATGYGTQHTDLVLPLFLYSMAVLLLFASGVFVIGTRRFERRDLG